jgi:uncharacterized metal-binding protein YceD (DUF177 family)
MSESELLSEWVSLAELRSGPVTRLIAADEKTRERLAEHLGLSRLDRLEAEVKVSPWLDGAIVEGVWSALIEQVCSVTLDPFASELEGSFRVRVLPRSSPNAPQEEGREIAIDLETEDPPDLIDEDRVDAAAYVVEHLALEIDPFPRKPGVEFEAPEEETPASPFAALRDLKPKPDRN